MVQLNLRRRERRRARAQTRARFLLVKNRLLEKSLVHKERACHLFAYRQYKRARGVNTNTKKPRASVSLYRYYLMNASTSIKTNYAIKKAVQAGRYFSPTARAQEQKPASAPFLRQSKQASQTFYSLLALRKKLLNGKRKGESRELSGSQMVTTDYDS